MSPPESVSKLTELYIAHLERVLDRQLNRSGQLTTFALGVLAASLAAIYFVIPNIERPPGRYQLSSDHYRLILLWEGAAVGLLWAVFANLRCLLGPPIQITADSFKNELPALALIDQLQRLKVSNEQSYRTRLRRFCSGQAMICTAIFPLALAMLPTFEFSSTIPLALAYLASGFLTIALAINLYVYVGAQIDRPGDLWLAPVIIIAVFTIGPGVLTSLASSTLHALPEELVVLVAVCLYLLAISVTQSRQVIRSSLQFINSVSGQVQAATSTLLARPPTPSADSSGPEAESAVTKTSPTQ